MRIEGPVTISLPLTCIFSGQAVQQEDISYRLRVWTREDQQGARKCYLHVSGETNITDYGILKKDMLNLVAKCKCGVIIAFLRQQKLYC